MKISFVLPGVFIAGGVRAIFECANRLQQRGHKVSIVYPAVLLSYSFTLTPWQICAKFLQMCRESARPEKVDWFALDARLSRVPVLDHHFTGLIERGIPDADVIVASTWKSAYTVAKLGASKGKKAYFVQHYEAMGVWNDPLCWDSAAKRDPDPRRIFNAMAGVVPTDPALRKYKDLVDASYSLPLAKFTTSVALENLIAEGFRQKSFGRIPIGNNLATFYPEGEKADANVILIPFRGSGWKGNTDVLETLELLRRKRSDFKVILFGSSEMKAMVPSWADFRASVSDSALRRLYTQADIFVSPTWVEGWCSPPMEAMSCGTACVTTDVGAVSEYAENGKTALIVPARDPQRLAAAIGELLDDKKRRNELARNGQAAIQKYTWDNAVDAMEAILRAVAQA
jgi:glycosyltransferase involved in cell wall biosynthesis